VQGNGRGGKEKDGENDLTHPLSQIPGYATEFEHNARLYATGKQASDARLK